MKLFSERLRYAMHKRNMKQSVLSYRTGIAQSYISRYLSGIYEPKHDKIQKLAKVLQVSEMWLGGYDAPIELEETKTVVKIPILGYVAAGIPIEAITDILDYEEISPDMIKDGSEYFGLEIKGDSMEPVISNGDYVIVKQQETCDSGQIAIVCVNGDNATCKKIIRQESGIMLVPFNPQYETVFYSNEQIEQIPITIFGVVVEQRRKFIK
jgi:repressor LexA